ncbi:hypothetical protein EMCRGX_G008466 [Ephydatia muelleri]
MPTPRLLRYSQHSPSWKQLACTRGRTSRWSVWSGHEAIRSCCRPRPSWRLESLKKECVHRKLGHREDYPRLLRGDAAPGGPGGPGLPKEQDERWQVTDVCVSNGMAWSPGNTKMYHMDSGLRKLWSFNFDDVSSCLTNRQVCWWTSTTRGWGIPDAMCTDSEGRLWRAGLFGATIVLVGPSHRRAVGQYQVPSPSHDVVLLLGGGGEGGEEPLS